MRILIPFLCLLLIQVVSAAPMVATVVDYLRETPASVSGNIVMDKVMPLYSGKKGILPVTMKANPKKEIGFSFSEKHLQITSDSGIILTVAGIPVKIKSIYYHEATGKFEVKSDAPFGLGLAEGRINASVEEVLNTEYKPKIIRAFKELKTVRSKDNLHDVNEVTASITKIFTDGKPASDIPTITGDINLEFSPQGNKDLKLDQWTAKIKDRDDISMGVSFVRKGPQTTITAAHFRSTKGIRVYGKTDYPEIASLNLQGFDADHNGIKFYYDIGAEEVITGFKMLIAVVGAYNGHPENVYRECDPVKLQKIRDSIDGSLKVEIANMIRKHRQTLLKGGISPQLLAALD